MRKLSRKIMAVMAAVTMAIGVASSCTNIDELSDTNNINAFTLVSYAPHSIELAATQIVQDTIYIPIVFGKYEFPLKFYAQVDLPKDVAKIVGIDLAQEQCLQSIDDLIKFYVMAKSGLTRTYIIKAREVPLDENNYISTAVKINEISQQVPYSARCQASTKGDTLTIFTVGGEYPITITPEFTIPDEADFENFNNGTTRMEFSDQRNSHIIRVVSKSGAKRYWNVRVKCTPITNDAQTPYPPAQLATTNIDPRGVVVTPAQGTTCETYVDNQLSNIRIKARAVGVSRSPEDGLVDYPYSVQMAFEYRAGMDLVDIEASSTIEFESESDTKEFYIVDPIKGIARRWTVNLNQELSSQADVLGISFDWVAASIPTNGEVFKSGWGYSHRVTQYEECIKLLPDLIEIYPDLGEIIIPNEALREEYIATAPKWPYQTVKNYRSDKLWKLNLTNISMTLSKQSTAEVKSDFEWASNYKPAGIIAALDPEQPNTCWNTVIPFEVTAQDGTVKNWKIKLRNPKESFTPSNKCDLSALTIDKVLPTYTLFDKQEAVVIDAETKTISIKLLDDDKSYPMSIYPRISVSDYATISSQNGGKNPLQFETAESTQTITVMAQDGTTSSDWTVLLVSPPKAVGAEIEQFAVLSADGGFTFDEPQIDSQSGRVVIPVTTAGKLPFAMNYNIEVTEKATASISTNGTIEFNSVRNKTILTITAQNGDTKEWRIELDYRPQIPANGLNKWSNDSKGLLQPESPWCTANNSNVAGTSAETRAGDNADMVAILSSKVTVGQFAAGSIFLGKFEFNMGIGLNDPISLTYFGYPFQTTGKIKGIEVEVAYTGGTSNYGMSTPFDYGSAVVELLDYNNKATDPTYSQFEYHGLYPDDSGPRTNGRANKATVVASGTTFVANQNGYSHKGTKVENIETGKWTKIFVPLTYKASDPDHTHIHIAFSCSAMGANFKGYMTSVLKVDNVKIIYE